MTRRPKRSRPPASPRPWKAVVLAVDPAKQNGWSLWRAGLCVGSGECPLSLAPIAEVVRTTLQLADAAQLPCVLVLERPFQQKAGRAFGASGKGRETWQLVWADLGGFKSRVVHVYPSTWRSKVLGPGHGNMARDDVRPVEQRAAVSLLQNYSFDRPPADVTVGPDESAALCIGRWATHAGEVGAALPLKLRRVA